MKAKEKELQGKKKRVIELKKPEITPEKVKLLWSEAAADLKTRKFQSEAEMLEVVIDLISKKINGGTALKNFLETALITDPQAMEILRKELL